MNPSHKNEHDMTETPTAVTNGIKVTVRTNYSDPYSSPPYRYFFAYHVTISNLGKKPVQLVSRRWVIRDAAGRVQVVEGPGVVGEQPHIKPGESYQYTSGCPLTSPYGEMSGLYRMVDSDGASFEAAIPLFQMIKAEEELN